MRTILVLLMLALAGCDSSDETTGLSGSYTAEWRAPNGTATSVQLSLVFDVDGESVSVSAPDGPITACSIRSNPGGVLRSDPCYTASPGTLVGDALVLTLATGTTSRINISGRIIENGEAIQADLSGSYSRVTPGVNVILRRSSAGSSD